METRWGLDLDMSAVRLMRRDGDEWVEKAVEKIDSPDIEERLIRLIEPIEDDAAVMLFLPREQILFTSAELDASNETQAQIEQAMEGRTPYSLDELSVDWEIEQNNTVRIAAIARDTLDEAAAFAEVRNLKIAGYSTLFAGEDFPRFPVFDGPDLVAEAEKPIAEPVPFTTARVPSRPPEPSVAAAAAAATAKARLTPTPTSSDLSNRQKSEPVVMVEDETPVVQVKAPQAPLDPGLPISAPNAPPRVRTDIAAASVSVHAASLTPPQAKLNSRKVSPIVSTAAVFAIALLLTIGVAVLVWNYLPMRPTTTVDAPVDTGALPKALVEEETPTTELVPETDVAAIPSPEEQTPAPEIAPAEDVVVATEPEPETETEPSEPSQPIAEIAPLDVVPSVTDDIAQFSDAEIEDLLTVSLGKLAQAPTATEIAPLPAMPEDALPSVDLNTPFPNAPPEFANILKSSPFQGPEPDVENTANDVYFSAFELPNNSGDAIALPNSGQFIAGVLPNVTGEVAAAPEAAQPSNNPVASAVEQALADALAGPAGMIPTDLARSLTDRAPRARPERFSEDIERQQFGGRTRAELGNLRPPAKPESAQIAARQEIPEIIDNATQSASAPKLRPANMANLVAAARVQQEAERVTASAALRSPDTSGAIEAALEDNAEPAARPAQPQGLNIPTTASVARQATIENAIRLNRINLVGVYGAPSNRRALVRLSSGRYVKVQVGDRVDGGTVAQITDSALFYRKGNRTLSLEIPKG